MAQRADPLPTEPLGTGPRIREFAAEAIHSVRRSVLGFLEEARGWEPAFRWKAGIVAGWIALSLVCLQVATSGPQTAPSNSLGAYVALTRTAMGWGLLVENQSSRRWEAVEVVVNGRWTHRRETIDPDEKVVLGPFQFLQGDENPPADLPIESVSVHTRRGSATPSVVR